MAVGHLCFLQSEQHHRHNTKFASPCKNPVIPLLFYILLSCSVFDSPNNHAYLRRRLFSSCGLLPVVAFGAIPLY